MSDFQNVRMRNVVKTEGVKWKFKTNAASDKATSRLEYTDEFEGWASRCPLIGSSDPYLPTLTLVDVDAERIPGGQIKVVLLFEARGATADFPGKRAGGPVERYEVRFQDGEEHILSHSIADGLSDDEIKALFNISNGSESDEVGTKWDTLVTSDDGLKILAKIRKGNTQVVSGSLFYIARKTITDLNQLEYSKLKTIQTPPGNPGGSGNWLYKTASAPSDADGLTYELERVYQYSPDGWDPDLYSPT